MSNEETKLAIKHDEIKDEKLIDYIQTYKKVFPSYLARYISGMLGYKYSEEQIIGNDGKEVMVKTFFKDLEEAVAEKEVFYLRIELYELFSKMIDFENTNIGVVFKLEIDKEQQKLLEKMENLKRKVQLFVSYYNLPDIEWIRDAKNIEMFNYEDEDISVEEIIEGYNSFKKYNKEIDIRDIHEWDIAFDFFVKNRCKITDSNKLKHFIKIQKWIEEAKYDHIKPTVLINILDIENFSEDDIKEISEIGKKYEICLKTESIAEINDNIIKKLNARCVEINKAENIVSQKLPIEKYKKIRSILEQVVEGIDCQSSEEQKFKVVYTRLAHMLTYDDEAAEDGTQYAEENTYKSRNLENGLLLGKCICVGYAEILKQALSLVEIKSHVITNGEHTWNVIQINGEWYNADLTWDYEYIRNNLPPRFCLKNDKDFINKCETEEGHKLYGKPVYKCEMPSMEIYPELKKNIIQYKIKKMVKYIKSNVFKLPKAILKIFSRQKPMLPQTEAPKEDNTGKEDFRASLTKDVPNQQEQAESRGERKEGSEIEGKKDNFEGR